MRLPRLRFGLVSRHEQLGIEQLPLLIVKILLAVKKGKTMHSSDRQTNDPGARQGEKSGTCRREFLKTAGALAAAVAVTGQAMAEEGRLPQIRFGKHSISRLVCGANPFDAGSHLSVFVNRAMQSYYTPEQILKTLRRCAGGGDQLLAVGRGPHFDLYRRLVDEGGKMHFLALGARTATRSGTSGNSPRAAASAWPTTARLTDHLFKTGQLDQVHDYLKQVRDAGLPGRRLHAHARRGRRHRVQGLGPGLLHDLRLRAAPLGGKTWRSCSGRRRFPSARSICPSDPPRMFKAIQQTKRPCLAFKILAAGRLSEHAEWVEQAFRETFAAIKPSDGMIVGIYDRYSDQPAEDAEFVRRFGGKG